MERDTQVIMHWCRDVIRCIYLNSGSLNLFKILFDPYSLVDRSVSVGYKIKRLLTLNIDS